MDMPLDLQWKLYLVLFNKLLSSHGDGRRLCWQLPDYNLHLDSKIYKADLNFWGSDGKSPNSPSGSLKLYLLPTFLPNSSTVSDENANRYSTSCMASEMAGEKAHAIFKNDFSTQL